MDSRVPLTDPADPASSGVTWPVKSGLLPPLAEGFVARPESAPGLGQAVAPGTTVALLPAKPARMAVAPGSPDWAGSCGKTQLAAYYANSLWQSRELDLLVWVTATNRASILSAYVAAAAAAIGVDPAGDAEAVALRFVGWLAGTSKRWLVVLDDLCAAADIEGLWPSGPAGRTLITTTEPAVVSGQPQLAAFPISGLSRREALSFVLGRLTDDRGQRTGAIDLVDLLDGEPLALGQASSVLDISAMSCRQYLEHFARKREQLSMNFAGRPASAAISWPLCVEQAYRLQPGGPIQPLLVLAAVLDGRWIPGTVFTSAAAHDYAAGAAHGGAAHGSGTHGSRAHGSGAHGSASGQGAWACIANLERAGMLMLDLAATPPIVRMHPAVQAAIRAAASPEMLDRAVMAAAGALLEIWPADDARGWLTESVRSCALAVIRVAGDRIWSGESYRQLFRAGQSLEAAKLTMLAAAHWNHVAAASERFLGAGHPDALAASDHLAAAFLAAGRALDALPWFRRVLADRVKMLGSDHPATSAFEVSVGRALLAAARPDEAIALFEKVISEHAQPRGPEQADAADAQDALADAYCAAGRLSDGIRQYQRILSERERSQGNAHPATIAICEKLADAYLAANRAKDAISAYKRVMTSRERAIGRDHPDSIAARAKLALANQVAGRMAAAIQLHEESHADSERVLGIDHPDTLTRSVNLAHAYYAVGRIGDAASLLCDTAERCDRVLPPGDPLTQTVRQSLVDITGR